MVALNLGERERELVIPVADRIPDGVVLSDALGGIPAATVADGALTVTSAPGSVAVLVSGNDVDLLAPDAPAGLSAAAGPGRVELTWERVEDAASYRVLRSIVAGGGYEAIGDAAETRFTDASLRDGVPYHYVVVALDAAGNVSARSGEAAAVPQLTITEARVLGVVDEDGVTVGQVQRPLSAFDGAVAVDVLVASGNDGGGTDEAKIDGAALADGVLVDVRIQPAELSAILCEGGTPSRAEVIEVSESGALFRGPVQPESVGSYTASACVSTDGGETWQSALGVGSIDVVPNEDTLAPPAPSSPELLDVSGELVRFRWAASEADDLYRYLVLRGQDGVPAEVIGTTDVEVYLDSSVTAGATYAYSVVAQDAAYNRSEPSGVLEVVADERVVDVAFRVTVPPGTTSDDTIYIAGSFQGWNPGGDPMTRLDDSTWVIDVPFVDGSELEYKYTRGSWEAVEKDAGCGEIANRTLTVEYTADGSQTANDTVEKWRDLDQCP